MRELKYLTDEEIDKLQKDAVFESGRVHYYFSNNDVANLIYTIEQLKKEDQDTVGKVYDLEHFRDRLQKYNTQLVLENRKLRAIVEKMANEILEANEELKCVPHE